MDHTGEDEEDAASEISKGEEVNNQEDAAAEMSWFEPATTDETPWIVMARNQNLKQRSNDRKPEVIDEAEEKLIVHMHHMNIPEI